MNVGSWLRSLGWGQYEAAFIANAIDGDVLAELTEVDFEKMRIPLGDGKRFMRAISALAAGSPRAKVPQKAEGAERRHLTVMICDLVSSTAVTARLDPEDMGAVIDA
jgi:class 3 adenylate cyclase